MREVLVVVGLTVPEGSRTAVTTGICTSIQNLKKEVSHTVNTIVVLSFTYVLTYIHILLLSKRTQYMNGYLTYTLNSEAPRDLCPLRSRVSP